ncbi:MAG: TonB-dependent receptor [Bacteroidales bacterium]|nr:TonB-dependent receptor [Bacteroidales bacterium]
MKRITLFLLLLLQTFALVGQITDASINGKITDINNKVLSQATVIATYLPTGTRYNAVSDKDGHYHLQQLRPGGPYSIEVRSMGFQAKTINGIQIGLGEHYVLNVTLEVSDTPLMEVTISAEALSDKGSGNGGITTSVTSEQIAMLPTISRSMNDVLALTPQAVTTSDGLAIGGGNYRQSYVNVDGASFHNSYGIGNNLPAGGSPIALDALEAINISIAPYDVRQSGFTGGVVNAITKSGSNDLHVHLYDYFTHDKMIGTEFGVKDIHGLYPERLKLERSLENTIGVSVGGPIVKDKLFYFINMEYQSDIDNGQSRLAREREGADWGNGTQYNRPTVTKMDEIRNYLQEAYGYDPGPYQNYTFSTPDYRFLARLDWNINKDNRLQFRYSTVRHQFFSTPSNSITPLSSSLYNKNSYGRCTDYAMYFESSNYIQQRNFSSAAAELNSRFLNGRLSNMLRAVYSLQYEPRKMTRDVFPTVDILEPLEDGTKTVYTSFGPDPFTYGTGSKVHTFIATDELSYYTGMHHLIGGLQFELDKTINGFMQGGAGYYVYNSWDDFVSNATPAAFTVTFGNNDAHEQAFPSFNYLQYSLYAQDKITLSEHFDLTAGLRLELPCYPSIADYNTNLEFDSLAALPSSFQGLSTADMPQSKPNLSPRMGFQWDILGNGKLRLQGGSGIYTGRIPLVWIVTAVCNSNVAQCQYLTYGKDVGFYPTVDEMIAHNPDFLKTGELPAPQYATILDKSLKMPQSWKSSLSLDGQLPGGVKASIEGVFSKDLTSVTVTRLGIKQDTIIQLPGELTPRVHWTGEGMKNSIGLSVNPFLITNSELNGYYYSLTSQLSKAFPFGLSLMAAYTYAKGVNVIDGLGDQVMTAYTSNTYGVNGSNMEELGYSSYVAPHHLLLNASWSWQTGKHTKETISLYYTGFNHCYVGNFSYSRYSYTLSSNVNGDGGANSLIYIPTEKQLLQTLKDQYVSAENAAAFNDFINADPYLSEHRGEYAMRGAAIAPWRHLFNLKYERSYTFCKGQTLGVGIDVYNVANLLYRGWGNIQRLSSSDILTITTDGLYRFNEPDWNAYANVISTWSAALSLRYLF